MKAVIVECSNSAAVALCDDGSFRRIKNRDYSIGQELLIKEKITPNHVMQKLSICASLALVLLSFVGIGSYGYVQPYSYVSLDINPSIEYALNRYDKVISVSGINDNGQQVVSSIESDVKNQNITTALGVTIKQLEKENYIVQEAYNHVIVSVCSANDTKARSIASSVDTFSVEELQVCSIDTVTVSKEIKDNADSLGITPGKLALIHAVAEVTSDSDFDVSEWTDMTVSELETTIQQASSQSPDLTKDPAETTVIDSEYLSSILDDTTANGSDNTATASVIEADKQTDSTTTDKQTSITNDTTAGSSSDLNETDASSEPDNAGNFSSAENNSSASKNDPGDSDKSDTTSDNTDNSSPDQNTSPDKSSDTDSFTEDSSIKKDPYPNSDPDTLVNPSNPSKDEGQQANTAVTPEEDASIDDTSDVGTCIDDTFDDTPDLDSSVDSTVIEETGAHQAQDNDILPVTEAGPAEGN